MSTPVMGRKIQGEKGIGQFAILKLGKTVSTVSRPEGLQSQYTLGLRLSPYEFTLASDFR
jgi:hypothetical protein